MTRLDIEEILDRSAAIHPNDDHALVIALFGGYRTSGSMKLREEIQSGQAERSHAGCVLHKVTAVCDAECHVNPPLNELTALEIYMGMRRVLYCLFPFSVDDTRTTCQVLFRFFVHWKSCTYTFSDEDLLILVPKSPKKKRFSAISGELVDALGSPH
jgi:hypothetical protein